jgi:hypothetical protein
MIEYTVSRDPSGLFGIDPITAEVRLRPGATLDYETSRQHIFEIAATDVAGLRSIAVITIQVLDIDVIERDVRLVFRTRDWSFNEDDLAQNSSGLEVFGLTTAGQTEYCYTVPADDAIHTDNFSSSWWNGWPSAPMSFEAEFSGTFCGSTSVEYDYGTWNAYIPMDIQLSVPDEVAPGSTFTLTSSAVPSDDGAALWGTGPGMEFGFGIRLAGVSVYLAGCDNLFSRSCAVWTPVSCMTSVTQNRSGMLCLADWRGCGSYRWQGTFLPIAASDPHSSSSARLALVVPRSPSRA